MSIAYKITADDPHRPGIDIDNEAVLGDDYDRVFRRREAAEAAAVVAKDALEDLERDFAGTGNYEGWGDIEVSVVEVEVHPLTGYTAGSTCSDDGALGASLDSDELVRDFSDLSDFRSKTVASYDGEARLASDAEDADETYRVRDEDGEVVDSFGVVYVSR